MIIAVLEMVSTREISRRHLGEEIFVNIERYPACKKRNNGETLQVGNYHADN